MSIRTNEVNLGGIVTVNVAGGNMPADNYCNPQAYISRVTGLPVTGVVVSNNHPVEIGADGGIWDTTSGIIVQRNLTNLDSLNV
jgi:hypothetical protein